MNKAIITICVVFALSIDLYADNSAWPEQVQEISYLSCADDSYQRAMFYSSAKKEKMPLLVALHSWSANYKQDISIPYAKWCVEKKWVLIAPDFRGPNNKPDATGSELVVADILSAVEFAKTHANIDSSRVYLVGVSGGGYAALLMAGRSWQTWTAVSAWVPIVDLEQWYVQCSEAGRHYADEIAASCGGEPGENKKVDQQYVKRSAIAYLKNATSVRLDINAGIHDGHTGSVPISHSLWAFNAVCNPGDRISSEDIDFFVENQKVPANLTDEYNDPTYGDKKVLFRRSSGNARVTVFEGSHEIIYEAALNWLSSQQLK